MVWHFVCWRHETSLHICCPTLTKLNKRKKLKWPTSKYSHRIYSVIDVKTIQWKLKKNKVSKRWYGCWTNKKQRVWILPYISVAWVSHPNKCDLHYHKSVRWCKNPFGEKWEFTTNCWLWAPLRFHCSKTKCWLSVNMSGLVQSWAMWNANLQSFVPHSTFDNMTRLQDSSIKTIESTLNTALWPTLDVQCHL